MKRNLLIATFLFSSLLVAAVMLPQAETKEEKAVSIPSTTFLLAEPEPSPASVVEAPPTSPPTIIQAVVTTVALTTTKATPKVKAPVQAVKAVPSKPSAPSPAPVATGGGLACGGDLPPCYVMRRESGGDPRIWNGGCYNGPCRGGSTASGKWQFLRSTWNGYGGYRDAADAPVAVQDAKARLLWNNGKGCRHWSAC